VGSVIAQINSAYKVARHYGIPAVGGGHAIYIAADQMMNVRSEHCPAEYLQAINYAAMGFQGCGLGNIVYGKWKKAKDDYELSYKPEMDSLRYAIPRFNYPDEILGLMFKIMGMANQEGIYNNLIGGLKPNNYMGNGFYHFGGKYEAADINEFFGTVGRIQDIATAELGL
jgi:tryptophanase